MTSRNQKMSENQCIYICADDAHGTPIMLKAHELGIKPEELIEKNYNLGKIVSFKGIKKGIENTNYLLKTKDKKFILTLFERRVQKKDLPFFMNLMDKLSKYKINCPKPQKNKRGSFLIKIKKAYSEVFKNNTRVVNVLTDGDKNDVEKVLKGYLDKLINE